MIHYKDKKRTQKSYWVGLSGGVDSSVAALLLKQSGAKLRAIYMKNWEEDQPNPTGATDPTNPPGQCHDKEDILAAAAVADILGIEFEIINFAKQYRQKVFDPFLQTLAKGKTPNPDIGCNEHIKFFQFMQAAQAAGADGIATGHYARTDQINGETRLKKGEDTQKDQSYFLYRLQQQQLKNAVFPLGNLHKTTVRQLARKAGLANWSKKDSVGICFIGPHRFAPFIKQYIPATAGEIQDENGNTIGEHQGLAFYTIGQRRGIGIGGRGGSWYVAAKNIQKNILTVVQGKNHPALYAASATLTDLHWISGTPPASHWVYTIRLRHQHDPASCTLVNQTPESVKIFFAESQRAVTAGQHAVLYDGNVCLGGGIIV